MKSEVANYFCGGKVNTPRVGHTRFLAPRYTSPQPYRSAILDLSHVSAYVPVLFCPNRRKDMVPEPIIVYLSPPSALISSAPASLHPPSTLITTDLLALLRPLRGKRNTRLNILLQPIIALLQQLLLIRIRASHNVVHARDTLLAQLNRDGEEIAAGLFGNGVAAGNAGQVDEGGFGDGGGALGGFDDFFGEAVGRWRGVVSGSW